MRVSYDKLWKLMKANKMKKQDLAKAAELSSYMMTQLGKDEYVSLFLYLTRRLGSIHSASEKMLQMSGKKSKVDIKQRLSTTSRIAVFSRGIAC